MTANETLRRRIAAYGASDELLDQLTREIRKVRAQIADAEEQHSRPEIGSELSVLKCRLAELRDRLYSSGPRGEETRQQAKAELRRMRAAFDEVVEESEESTALANLAEDLLDDARPMRERRSEI